VETHVSGSGNYDPHALKVQQRYTPVH
jgi:hypothetical protein